MVKFLLNIEAAENSESVCAAQADILGFSAKSGSASALRQAQNLAAAAEKIALSAGRRPALALSLPFSALAEGGAKIGGAADAPPAGKGRSARRADKSANIEARLSAAGRPFSQIYLTVSAAEFAAQSPLGQGGGEADEAAHIWGRAALLAKKYPVFLIIPCAEAAYDGGRAEFLRKADIWRQKARKGGFCGVFLACAASPSKNRADFIRFLGDFLQKTREAGLQGGIIGGLQLPDIPRLLPYQPDYLGFACQGEGARQREDLALIRRSIPLSAGGEAESLSADRAASKDAVVPAETEGGFSGTDRILVSDFIVPMRIGVYAHEKGVKQRVCFNIAADISRIGKPHSMNHIFSYDIILDEIMRLAERRHIEFVETLAEDLADFLLKFPRVQRAMVRVEKLDLGPRSVGIEIIRSKQKAVAE